MRWFFGSFDPIHNDDLRPKIFWVLVENLPSRCNFMPLGVVGEYGRALLAYSPYALKYFARILRIRLKLLSIFGDKLVQKNNSKIAVIFLYA
jgi:hypothetical protein